MSRAKGVVVGSFGEAPKPLQAKRPIHWVRAVSVFIRKDKGVFKQLLAAGTREDDLIRELHKWYGDENNKKVYVTHVIERVPFVSDVSRS